MHFWFCTNSSCKLHQNLFPFYYSITLYVVQFMGSLRDSQKCFWEVTNINSIWSFIIRDAFYNYWISFTEGVINIKSDYNKHKTTQNCIFYPMCQHVSLLLFLSPGTTSAKQNANNHLLFYYWKSNFNGILMWFLFSSRTFHSPLLKKPHPSSIWVAKNLHLGHTFYIQINPNWWMIRKSDSLIL